MHANDQTPHGLLIDELLPGEHPAAQRNGNGRAVLGAHTLSVFLQGVNWANAVGYQSPFVAAAPESGSVPRRVLGALPLREFLAGVNWTNAAAAPPLDIHSAPTPDHARLVLDTFMNEINWD